MFIKLRKDSVKLVKRYLPRFFGQIWLSLLAVQRQWGLSPPIDSQYATLLDKLALDCTTNGQYSMSMIMASETWSGRNVVLVPGTALRCFARSNKMVVLRCDEGRISVFDTERLV